MLRLLRHLLYRFRWPVLTALLTVPLLAFLFQPRPVAEYQIPDDPSSRFRNHEPFLISPSGSYLVWLSWNVRTLYMYQLEGMKLLFKQRCIGESTIGFDDHDGLAVASYGSNNNVEDDSMVEWWRWEPGQLAPKKLGSRKAFPAGLRTSFSSNGEQFNGLMTFGRNRTINGLLSPDSRTWLFPSLNEATIHFDLIDTKSGEVKARLECPEISRERSKITNIEVIFVPDSKQLLTQSIVNDSEQYQEQFVLDRFDAQTGKLMSTRKLPDDSKLGYLLQFDQDHLVAMKNGQNTISIQWLSKENGYRLLQLPETTPDPAETTLGNDWNFISQAHIESSPHIQAAEGKVTFCWEHALYPKHGGSGAPPYIPEYHYAVRDIATGRLIHTETITNPDAKKEEYHRSGWSTVAILPGQFRCFENPFVSYCPGRKPSKTGEKYCTLGCLHCFIKIFDCN